MRNVMGRLIEQLESGEMVVLCSVVNATGSAPLGPGTSMLRLVDGAVVGSISGGCVEAAALAVAEEVMASGIPRLESYGYSDPDAVAVGLTCGGTLEVLVERIEPAQLRQLQFVRDQVVAGQSVAIATVISNDKNSLVGRRIIVDSRRSEGTLGYDMLDSAVTDDARGLLAAGASQVLTYGPEGETMGVGTRVLVESCAPRPRLLIFGAVDFAAALASQGRLLGFRVTVCDARAQFATEARFPTADEVVVSWPDRYLRAEAAAGRIDRRTAICILAHDSKFDVPLVEAALEVPVAYLGAMGSRRTHDQRHQKLVDRGASEVALARLRSPIGLDLGGRTPEETAVSIVAEIVAMRWGGHGLPLATTGGPIHHDQALSDLDLVETE